MIADILADHGIPALLGCVCWVSIFALAVVWIAQGAAPDDFTGE